MVKPIAARNFCQADEAIESFTRVPCLSHGVLGLRAVVFNVVFYSILLYSACKLHAVTFQDVTYHIPPNKLKVPESPEVTEMAPNFAEGFHKLSIAHYAKQEQPTAAVSSWGEFLEFVWKARALKATFEESARFVQEPVEESQQRPASIRFSIPKCDI